jgi:hypothetical protein
LETLYAPRLEEAYERLAYHYARTDNVGQAVAYLTRVVEKAARHSAHVEAISHLAQALELLQTLPATPERSQQELTLHIALGASLLPPKAMRRLRWSRPTPAPGSSVTTWTTPISCSQRRMACVIIIKCAPSIRRPVALGEQLLTLAQQAQDSAMLLVAHRALGTTLLLLGAAASSQLKPTGL